MEILMWKEEFFESLQKRDQKEKKLGKIVKDYQKLLKETAHPNLIQKLKQETLDLLRDQAEMLQSTLLLSELIKEAEMTHEDTLNEIKSVGFEKNRILKEILIHEKELDSLNMEIKRRDEEMIHMDQTKIELQEENELLKENNDLLIQDITNIEDYIERITSFNDPTYLKKPKIPSKQIKQSLCHTEALTCVKFHPQGSLYATGSEDHSIKIFDAGTFLLHSYHNQCTKAITSISFYDEYLLGISKENVARIWSISKNKLIYTLSGHKNEVLSGLIFENKVFTTSLDRTVKFWDIRSGSCTKTLSVDDVFLDVREKDQIIYGCTYENLYMMDPRYRIEKATKVQALKKGITSIDVSSDGRYLLSNQKDNTIDLIDLRQLKTLSTYKHNDYVNSVTNRPIFSSDNNYFCVGSNKGAILIWKVSVLQSDPKVIIKGHEKPVTCVEWNYDSSLIISGGMDKCFSLYGNEK